MRVAMNENRQQIGGYDGEGSPSFAICKAAMRIRGVMGRRLKDFDITPEQWGVIAMLRTEDGITQKELAFRIFKDQPNITRILDKLAVKNFIRRADAAGDRRAFYIYLTEEGKEMYEKLHPIVVGLRGDICRDLSPDEIELLVKMLNRICVDLE
jgi:DNA-binding MarR family transcriptional regulator